MGAHANDVLFEARIFVGRVGIPQYWMMLSYTILLELLELTVHGGTT